MPNEDRCSSLIVLVETVKGLESKTYNIMYF